MGFNSKNNIEADTSAMHCMYKNSNRNYAAAVDLNKTFLDWYIAILDWYITSLDFYKIFSGWYTKFFGSFSMHRNFLVPATEE